MTDFFTHNLFFALIGGLGLLLFGLKTLSEALQRLAGDRLRRIFSTVTGNRVLGVCIGAMVTAVVQSSSATAVMVVGLVNAGLISIAQALGVLLGANIGTTATAQLLAFDIGLFALPAIGVGTGLKLFFSRSRLARYGDVLLGFGILFLGLTILKSGFVPVRDSPAFLDFLLSVSRNRLAAVALGALLTVLVQSSSATIGLTLVLAGHGLLPFDICVALILGENIGTACSANLAALKTNLAARRTALAHLLFNLIGVIYVLFFFTQFIALVERITPGDPDFVVNPPQLAAQFGTFLGDKPFIGRHIANSHTLFNLINALVFLPLLRWVARLTSLLIKGQVSDDALHLKYLDSRVLNTPVLALGQAQMEARRMARLTLRVYDQTLALLPGYKQEQLNRLHQKEQTLDLMQREITDFLVSLSQQSITAEASREAALLMHRVSDLERIGDHCEDLQRLLVFRIDRKISFSDTAFEELGALAGQTREFLLEAVNSIQGVPEKASSDSLPKDSIISAMELELRNNHIQRLSTGECSTFQGLLFIDILHHVEQIGEHVGNLVQTCRDPA